MLIFGAIVCLLLAPIFLVIAACAKISHLAHGLLNVIRHWLGQI